MCNNTTDNTKETKEILSISPQGEKTRHTSPLRQTTQSALSHLENLNLTRLTDCAVAEGRAKNRTQLHLHDTFGVGNFFISLAYI